MAKNRIAIFAQILLCQISAEAIIETKKGEWLDKHLSAMAEATKKSKVRSMYLALNP